MKVKCISTNGSVLSQRFLMRGYTKESIMNLELNKEYIVYGISLYGDTINYLLSDETGKPNWYPSDVLKIIDQNVPSNWKYQIMRRYTDNLNAIWGYDELVNSESHYDGLINRVASEIDIFNKIVAAS